MRCVALVFGADRDLRAKLRQNSGVSAVQVSGEYLGGQNVSTSINYTVV